MKDLYSNMDSSRIGLCQSVLEGAERHAQASSAPTDNREVIVVRPSQSSQKFGTAGQQWV